MDPRRVAAWLSPSSFLPAIAAYCECSLQGRSGHCLLAAGFYGLPVSVTASWLGPGLALIPARRCRACCRSRCVCAPSARAVWRRCTSFCGAARSWCPGWRRRGPPSRSCRPRRCRWAAPGLPPCAHVRPCAAAACAVLNPGAEHCRAVIHVLHLRVIGRQMLVHSSGPPAACSLLPWTS